MQDDVDDDDAGLASPKISTPGLASPGVEISWRPQDISTPWLASPGAEIFGLASPQISTRLCG